MHFNPSHGLLNDNFDDLVLANFRENILLTIVNCKHFAIYYRFFEFNYMIGQQLSYD